MIKLMTAAAILLCATAAQAQDCSQRSIGNATSTHCTNGWQGTSRTYGDFTSHHFVEPNGQRHECTTRRTGEFSSTHCN